MTRSAIPVWLSAIVLALPGLAAEGDAAPEAKRPDGIGLWKKEQAPWIESATHFFIAPDGKAENAGTKEAPWDFESVLTAKQTVPPGSVVWVRAGTYRKGASIQCSLAGTKEKPIVIRAVPGERATWQDRIEVNKGGFVWFWGLEMTDPGTDRTEKRTGGVNLIAPGSKAINLVNHNCGHCAVGFWLGVGDSGEAHGCIFFANGMYDGTGNWKGGARGSPIYAQNKDGTRYITDVISFRNFTTGFKAYTEQGYADGFHIEGCITFDSPDWDLFCASKKNPMQRLKVLNNCTYRKPGDDGKGSVQLGYYGTDLKDAVVKDNYFVLGAVGDRTFHLKHWTDLDMGGNTIIGQGTLFHWIKPAGPATSLKCDGNTYHGSAAEPFKADGKTMDFEAWKKATGFDANSTLSPEYPKALKAFVRPNKYEPGRGHIAVYNWPKEPAAAVDISSILPEGAEFEIRDAQNYFGAPVVKGKHDGKPVSIPMNLTEIAKPVGEVPHIIGRYKHTAPEFGAFVVIGKVDASKVGK